VTLPGPAALGRSVVVAPGAALPDPWSDRPRVVVDAALLADRDRLAGTVDGLHRAWASRSPVVVELGVDDAALAEPETVTAPAWEIGADFTFLRERLHFLVWNNSYDARRDPPVWWWAVKAERVGARVGGSRDVVLADGTEAWIDGGPRGPVDLDEPLVHAESVLLGRPTLAPPPVGPEGDLAADQHAAVAHGSGPARIVAPAGSGKTRVLTARVRHLLDDRRLEPETLCAVAYNRRAALEMRSRLGNRPDLELRTIHSLGWEILRSGRGGLTLLGEREVRDRLDPLVPAVRRPNVDVVGPYIEAMSEVRIGLQSPELVEARRDDVPDLPRVFAEYRRRLAERREADHDEQIFGAVEALLADPVLRRAWQGRCRHLLVDEFQDLTPAYLLLLRLVASPELDVFGVGDDDQVIYGYAGADPGFLIDFDRHFPGAASHPLEVNYRCPVPVVEAASTLLGYNLRRVDKTIRPGPGAAASGLVVRSEPGTSLGPVASEIVGGWLASGAEGSDVAVLARVGSTLLPVQAALVEAGVPIDGLLGPELLERTVMRAALAWIRLALDPDDMARTDLLEAIRRPSRGITGIGRELLGARRRFTLAELARLGGSLDVGRRAKWDQLCDDIALLSTSTADTGGLLDVLVGSVGLERAAAALDAGRSRADRAAQTDDLRALRRAAALHSSPGDFESWLRSVLSVKAVPGGVSLTTIHRVKGLEWDRVVVFGVDEGTLPHELSDDVEEERRVFHVALTRGRSEVVVLADAGRPSRFLTELDGRAPRPVAAAPTAPARRTGTPEAGVRVAVGTPVRVAGGFEGTVDEVLVTGVLVRIDGSTAVMSVPWGEEIRVGEASGPLVPGAPEPDAAVVERLRAWRRETARALGVPAYIVFTDATLTALAARRPASETELLAVPGIGPTKLDAYGDDILALVAE